MGIVFVIVLGVLPLVMAADDYENDTVQITVEDSGYPPSIAPSQKWFVPGDTIDLELQVFGVADGAQDVFDIIMFKSGDTTFADNVGIFDDIAVDPDTGRASVTISATKTMALPDGDYDVYVRDDQWIEDSGFDSGRGDWDWAWFRIQMYIIIAETDSTGYLPGDTVNVFYNVISIKDGRLITEEAFDGVDFDDREWGVWSEDGESTEGPTSLSEQSGSFDFRISTVGASFPDDYIIGIWFNGTYGAEREAARFLTGNMGGQAFRVDALDLNIWTDRSTYQLNSVVRVTVDAEVDGTSAPEPDVEVEITVLEGVGVDADKISGYGGDEFMTDAAGRVVYMFSVDPDDFKEDETYTVRVNITKWLKEAGQEVTFDVEAGGRAIATKMVFDKEVYTTGDTVNLNVETAVPVGASTDLTYIYLVQDPSSGTKAQEVSNSPLFSYDIPENFEGSLDFSVTVYNADGDQGLDMENKVVHYAVLLLNAEPEQYEPGDTITAEYELISTLMNQPTFFYIVRDAAGLIVLEGEVASSAMSGEFEYTVPSVASGHYDFGIMANQDGVMVYSDDTCYLDSGYDIEIWVDNPTYNPGDRVTIHYEIKARGDVGLPDKFVFWYGMSNGQMYTWQSDSPKGKIYYEIPPGVNEGDILMMAGVEDGDGNYLGEAFEVLHIQEGSNPLEWARFGDVPLFSWILLLLIIIIIIIMLLRRPSAPAPAKPAPEPEPEPVEEAPPELAEDAGPLAINCKSCGAEIEITTSKRPIEVMCPSCGETEMVE